MAQTPKDKKDENLDSLDDFDIDTSNFTLDELPQKDSNITDDTSLPEIDNNFNLIPEDNSNDDSFSNLSDLDLTEEPENEDKEIFLSPESISPADSDVDNNDSGDFSLDLENDDLSADNDTLNDSSLSIENLLNNESQLNNDDEFNLDEEVDLSGILDDDDFCGVALKEGPQTIISSQKQFSEDLIDSLIDEDENSDIINFSFPERNETVSQEDEDYLKLDLTEEEELLANEINANNNLDELSIHADDDNLLSDDELNKLVSKSSDKENEETETTIEDEEIIISDKNDDTLETIDNNEKDYEADFNGLDFTSLTDEETAEPTDDNFITNENSKLDLSLDDEESISLSDNELDDILDNTELTEETDELIEDNSELDLNPDDEESICLSNDELDDILDNTELTEDNIEETDELIEDNSELDLNLDDEESICLSGNELDNILDNTELIETEMLESIPEDEIDTKIEEMLNDDTSLNLEESTVDFSLNELDNILDTAELIETKSDEFLAETAEKINNSDLQPLTSSKEDDVAIYSSLKAEMQAKEIKKAEEKTELLKKDVKTVLSYLDQLLDALPEEKIKEFAESKEFDIYKKLFEELNIKIN